MRWSFILFLALFLLGSDSHAQNRKTDMFYLKLIEPHEQYYKSDDYFNKSYLFTVNIGVDKSGTIDTIIISSEKDSTLRTFLDFDQLRKKLVENKDYFAGYKHVVLVLLVSFTRGDTGMIQLGNSEQMLGYWRDISKTANQIRKMNRPQVFLRPIMSSRLGKYRRIF